MIDKSLGKSKIYPCRNSPAFVIFGVALMRKERLFHNAIGVSCLIGLCMAASACQKQEPADALQATPATFESAQEKPAHHGLYDAMAANQDDEDVRAACKALNCDKTS